MADQAKDPETTTAVAVPRLPRPKHPATRRQPTARLRTGPTSGMQQHADDDASQTPHRPRFRADSLPNGELTLWPHTSTQSHGSAKDWYGANSFFEIRRNKHPIYCLGNYGI